MHLLGPSVVTWSSSQLNCQQCHWQSGLVWHDLKRQTTTEHIARTVSACCYTSVSLTVQPVRGHMTTLLLARVEQAMTPNIWSIPAAHLRSIQSAAVFKLWFCLPSLSSGLVASLRKVCLHVFRPRDFLCGKFVCVASPVLNHSALQPAHGNQLAVNSSLQPAHCILCTVTWCLQKDHYEVYGVTWPNPAGIQLYWSLCFKCGEMF